ncbi:MAG TPA: radical SAM protein [Symbiobacteriaceae bacterium]|nr:radical SAM protein [Symbiobacteriaceae bacterium]
MRINEIFRSIQGETSSAGLPTVFVRTGGCNLRCTYCDTPYALTAAGSVHMTVDAVMGEIRKFQTKRVCLTGGEPLIQPRHEVQELLDLLGEEGYELSIETSGSISIAGFGLSPRQRWILDMKAPSSAESHMMKFECFDLLRPEDEIKFVLGTYHDFRWAVELIENYQLNERAQLLFSPVWGKVTPLQLTEWALDTGHDIRVQIQLHKIIWHPDTRGV